MITLIGVSKRIEGQMDRAQIIRGLGNTKHQQPYTIFRYTFFHIPFCQQRDTHAALVMRVVPEHLLMRGQLFLRQSVRRELSILLLHAQHNHAALSIRKSRKGFPKRPRKPTLCRLVLHFGFFLQFQVFRYVFHLVVFLTVVKQVQRYNKDRNIARYRRISARY